MDFPDIDQVESLANAEEDYLNKILENICDKGEYTPPDQFDDPALALELSLQYIAKGKLHNLDPERMEMLHKFNDQINLLLQKADPANGQPMPMDPTGMPQANPTATPTNNMIPNGAV